MQTILITGCSSGFGLEIARHFLTRDWQVIATMRTPQADLLPTSQNLRLLPLDVTDDASIAHCIAQAGAIDVLVNNAGIGVLHPLEATAMDSVRSVYATNTLGTIAMTQAVIPQFRQRGAGTIINVTSSVTYRPLPLLAAYTGSKAAVNAFTDSLALELGPLGIRVGLVLPGAAPGTSFGRNALPHMQVEAPAPYQALIAQIFANFQDTSRPITHAQDVAEAVWRMATDPASPRRLPAGADAVLEAGAGH
jgi:NAD(P)-dependent dehydrogenase (short-subunit alcohol dehydrogenase family)